MTARVMRGRYYGGELEEEEAPPVWFGRGELEEGLGDG